MNIIKPIPVVRGCGTRQAGGVYIESVSGPRGQPVETFLCDPPIRLPKNVKIAHRGITPFETTDDAGNPVTHLLDIIGAKYYENVADFIEEARKFGISRRIQRTFNFKKLDSRSLLILLHPKGYVENLPEYKTWKCPLNKPEHDPAQAPKMCAGVWWEDIEPEKGQTTRDITRKMPSFSYSARTRPAGLVPQHVMAIVGKFPISRITIIKGATADSAQKRAGKAGIPTEIEDQ